ncbi:MAG: hypothetical protein ACJ72N_25100 [Labedaea sp.]
MVAHLNSEAGGNPDLRLLYGAIQELGDVEIRALSTAGLVRHRCNLIHFYWPEWCVRRGSALLTSLDAARLLAGVAIARRRGAKVVWTGNNLWPHELDRAGVVQTFMNGFSRLVDQLICSSQTTLDLFVQQYPALRVVDHRVIPLGHYRGVYPDDGLSRDEAREKLNLPCQARIVLCIGMMRPYKGLVRLLHCYREIVDTVDEAFLLVAGKPIEGAFARRLRRECEDVKNVRLDMRFLPVEEIQYYLRAADCVINSTPLAVNSGSAMLALSYDRPVLLPHRGTFIELRETLGPEWVHTYEGGLRPQVLRSAFDIERPPGRPALDRYDWSLLGRLTYGAYADLVGAGRTASRAARR